MNVSNYSYFLPEKNLALEPAVSRDTSKLFVYDTKNDQIVLDRFYNLHKYLPKDSFMVMNNTKVLPARVIMKKESGGKVEALILVNEIIKNTLPIIVDRRITVGEKIYFDDKHFLEILSQNKNIFEVRFSFTKKILFSILEKYGMMPIPPYLKKSPLSREELLKKYQTIFAKNSGSSAAPTASLHFTDKLFRKLDRDGISRLFITLHVGMGTFAPINEENIKRKKLHEEYFEIDENIFETINSLKKEGKKLVAVGTTVVRTLESKARYQRYLNKKQNTKEDLPSPHMENSFEKTDLFIFPPYDFKMVDVLITNFHLPKSSLMMLVDAFLRYKGAKKELVELYNIAIKNDFRFYSFGDAMLIL